MKASDKRNAMELRFSSRGDYTELHSALVRENDAREHGAFLFATFVTDRRLDVVDVELLSPADFSAQSVDYLELRDDALQQMILRAHRTDTALVEAHSHPFSEGPWVEFSPFDCRGLDAAGPQISWRLPQRPYAALVFGRQSFDSLYWQDRKRRPQGVVDISFGDVVLHATARSLCNWEGERG